MRALNMTLFFGLAAATILTLLASGCVVDNNSVQQGVSLSGDWVVLVNGYCYGSNPTNASDCAKLEGPLSEGCQRAGYKTVRVLFYDYQGEFSDDRTTFDCNYQQGGGLSPGQFDSAPIEILQYGRYQTAWQALDANNQILVTSPRQDLTTTPPDDHIILLGAEFDAFQPKGGDAGLTLSWDVSGMGATLADRCTARGVTEVGFEFRRYDDSNSTPTVLTKAACNAGTYMTPQAMLAKGKYLFDYVFLDAQGNAVGRTSFVNVVISATGNYTVDKGTLP